ncbi:DUF2690 domain-containing protein [Streptomyces sp. NPDC005336]|uniref:helix-turn-helix domain-containing protein n=1 Tax=Streptomyces sp. NPDC005336 TaxID=3157035 RepID=UPI0033A8EDD6
MAGWKPLPDELESDAKNLVEQLRRFKDRSGLSLVALAETTLHSKSSWDRYLNGRTLPPRQAVESLGRLVGADLDRLGALWDLAERGWSGRGAPEWVEPVEPRERAARAESAAAVPGAPPPGSRFRVPARFSRPAARWTAAALAAALVAAGAALALRAADHGAPPRTDSARNPSASGSSDTRQLDTTCFAESCTGKDPKETRCAADAWTAALTKTHGVYVELRYSDSCKAAWARISWGKAGDIAEVVAVNGATRQDKVHYDTDVYTPMVASDAPSDVRACTTLSSGAHGCTKPGSTVHLTLPPEPPVPSSSAPRSSVPRSSASPPRPTSPATEYRGRPG